MKVSILPLALLTLLAGALVAPSARAGGGGVPPGTTPVAGPVEVFVQVDSTSVTAGSFVVADIALVNSSDELVRGALRVQIRFADGSTQRLRLPQPMVLDPDSTLLFQLFVPVAEDAALGDATFVATAIVGGPSTGGRRHIARDADTFEVVAP